MNLVKSQVIVSYNLDTIRNAKQFFSVDSEFAADYCDLAGEILNHLPNGDYVIDTRVHMLKPGWLPCIGGWHFDEVPRDSDGTLRFDKVDNSVEHYVFILDMGTGSLTEFNPVDFDAYELDCFGIKDYNQLNKFLSKSPPASRATVENNALYKFDIFSAHRGMQATGDGWRYFFRATKNSKRKVYNEIRTQTQVYVPEDRWEVGW